MTKYFHRFSHTKLLTLLFLIYSFQLHIVLGKVFTRFNIKRSYTKLKISLENKLLDQICCPIAYLI